MVHFNGVQRYWALRSGGNFSTNDDMKTELQYSTIVQSEQSSPPDAKPML